MSKLLDALIELRRMGVVSYREYLEMIARLTREATLPGGGPGGYPAGDRSAAQRALYNNLGKVEGLALSVDAAIMGSLQNGWKTNAMKTRKVRIAIRAVLAQAAAQAVEPHLLKQQNMVRDSYEIDALTDRILDLAKHHNDY